MRNSLDKIFHHNAKGIVDQPNMPHQIFSLIFTDILMHFDGCLAVYFLIGIVVKNSLLHNYN